MAELIILGTAAAIANADRDYTHLAVRAGEKFILVDSGGSPMTRLAQSGLDWRLLSDVVATHFHADHIAGLPNLIVGMWLSGRQEPLRIHGLQPTLEKIELLLELFDWRKWTGLFHIELCIVPSQERYSIIDTPELRVLASPTEHSIPALGLRFESKQTGKVAAYSGDTGPSESVVRLAQDAYLLLHEATGIHNGHSSAQQAGEIAQKARVNQLFLIHYPSPPEVDLAQLLAEARQAFRGPVTLAQESMRLSF